MKTMRTRIWGILLVLTMLLSLMPVTALAADGDAYDEWTNATSLPSRGMYKLTTNVTIADKVTVGGWASSRPESPTSTLTLDLNGYTVTATNGQAFFVQTSGGLIIEDSAGTGKITNASESTSSNLIHVNGGQFTLSGGTLENVMERGCALFVNSDSAVTITGGNIVNTVDGGDAVYVNGGTFEMTGGHIDQQSTYSSDAAIYANNSADSISISGGEISSACKGVYAAFTPVNVTGGTFDTDGYAFQTRNLTVEPADGREVSVTSDQAVIYSFSGSANEIHGGSFSAPYISNDYTDEDASTLEISGGKFAGLTAVEQTESNTQITISGGAYTNTDNTALEDVENYIDGDKIFNDETGAVEDLNEENAAASITKGDTTTYYKDLMTAITAAESGDTIELLADVELTSAINVPAGANITIEGNGYTISYDASVPASKTAFTGSVSGETEGVPANVKLTINDVVFTNTNESAGQSGYAVLMGSNAFNTTVTLTDCEFNNLYCAVYNNGVFKVPAEGDSNPAVSITGSIYTDTAYGYSVDEITPGAVIGAVNTEFDDSNELNGAIEAEPWFEVTDADGKVTKYNSFEAAFNAAVAGDTIKLAKDVELSEELTINKGIAIDGNGYTISYAGETAVSTFITVVGEGDGVTIKNVTIDTNEKSNHGVQFYCVTGGELENVTVNGGAYTSVMVNGSEVTMTNCVLNPDDAAYANIEYGMGDNVTIIPEITLNNVSGDADKPLVYADKATADRVNAKDDSIAEGATAQDIADAINDKYLEGAEITLNYKDKDGSGEVIDGTKSYTITFVIGYDDGKDPAPMTTNNEGKLSELPAPTRDGYDLVGWYDKDGKRVTTNTVFTANATLTAEWDRESSSGSAGGDASKPSIRPDTDDDDNDRPSTSTGLPFDDVDTGDWYYEAVEYVYENGLMNGVASDEFSPNATLTRGMMVTILYRLEGEPAVSGSAAFDDVDEDAWYADAVAWAAENGIVNGVSDTEYAPNANITREQLATMLYRYAQYSGMDAVDLRENISGFADADSVSEYAVQALNWAVGEELVNGMGDNTLAPQGNATRAQAAALLMRYVEYVA